MQDDRFVITEHEEQMNEIAAGSFDDLDDVAERVAAFMREYDYMLLPEIA